ncbi:P-loop containing nucleoside triphosphate hydrolase protein [Annulohypoxylon stygium]|nr:P-loop containing nucleoside triphosphate hydrolase protein [Annulohypoxylon stygium]
MLSLAPAFLDSLRQARPFESQRRPLYFICHSLSGVLLKQVLYLAHRDLPAIRNAIAGLMFLGSPHLTSPTDERWELWRLILRLLRKNIPKNALREEDIKILTEVCERFSGLNLEIPVLSVYEMSETKVRESGALGRFRSVEKVLVAKDHATCGTLNEELFGVPASHDRLTFVSHGSPLFKKLLAYLKEAPGAGRKVVNTIYGRLETIIEASDTISSTSERPTLYIGTNEQPPSDMANAMTIPRRLLLPCYYLEQTRNPSFFGQADILQKIDEVLTRSPSDSDGKTAREAPSALAVCGMGGLGKTELAIEYIHSRKEKFDAVFWINSSTTQKLFTGFRNISIMLGLQDEQTVLNEEAEVTRDKVKAWLANPVRTLGASPGSSSEDLPIRWLIVFDNADDPDVLYDFWPSGSNGCILITSRDQIAKTTSLPNLTGIELPPMPTDDAAILLQDMSESKDESDSIKTCTTIAEKLGGLPLAIVQMALFIRNKQLSLSEFVEWYEHDSKKLQETLIPNWTKQQTIAFVWNIESLDPSATALLQVLSFFDSDSIPEEILIKGAKQVQLENYPSDRPAYFEAREALMKSSLVIRNKQLGILRIHRLVQDVVRDKLDLPLFREVFNASTTLLSVVWPFIDNTNLNEVDRLRKVQRFQPQVSKLRSILEGKGVDTVEPSLMIAALFNESSWTYLLSFAGNSYSIGDDYAVLAQKVAELIKDGEDDELRSKILANSYRFQGIIGGHLGNGKAVSYTKKWVEMLVERITKYQKKEDEETLPIAYNEYGRALMWVPDKEEAMRSWEISCESVLQTTPEGKLPFPFPWMHSALVNAYDGKTDLAESSILPILEEREKKLGKDDTSTFETGLILTCVGNIRRVQGRKKDAYEFFQRANKVVPVATGERSLWSVQAYYRLAVDEFDRERYTEAHNLLEKVITFISDISWFEAIAARGNWKLGRTLLKEGGSDNEDEAQILLDRAMKIRHKLVPDDDRKEEDLNDEDWDNMLFYLYR